MKKQGGAKNSIFLIILILLILGGSVFAQITYHTDKVDIMKNESSVYPWVLDDSLDILSIRLNGSVSNQGTAKVYIENYGDRYLIMDSDTLKVQLGTTVPPGTTDENSEIMINLDYGDDPAYDTNNDGISTTSDIIDFTVNRSKFDFTADESKLCTQWLVNNNGSSRYVCYGGEECCYFVELSPTEEPWNFPFYLYYGYLGEGYENLVGARIVYADYNLSLDEPYSNVKSSGIAYLPAYFYPTEINFENMCIDTCSITGFNSSTYSLIFDIENSSVYIESIRYTINETTVINNKSLQETLSYGKVEINKPVTWKKTIQSDSPISNITINISDALDYSIIKKENGKTKDVKNFKEVKSTGSTGIQNSKKITQLNIEEKFSELTIEYSTPGPDAFEENTKKGKKITISSDIHYENIFAYTSIDESVKEIRLYWIVNDTEKEVSFDKKDNDNDGFIDEIEWIVPHLSTQIYEIIYISKAEHLDYNREFISDISDYVSEQDNNWTEQINTSEYVRIIFEKKLTSNNDITIYARGNGSILVYEEDGNETIAFFDSITDENYYQVYLTDLTTEQDTFDLRVIGYIEFDYIVDPMFGDSGNISFVDPTPSNATTSTSTNVEINVSIDIPSLSSIIYNWNGTNYTYYNDSLVLMMNFDNLSALDEKDYGVDNQTTDISKYGNNGSIYGTTWNITGKYVGAFEFDGTDDYILIADSASLDISQKTTFSAWIYPEAYGDVDDEYIKNIYSDEAADLTSVWRIGSQGSEALKDKLGVNYNDGDNHDIESTGSVSLNTWTYITAVTNGTHVNFYFNGVLDSSKEYTITPTQKSGSWRVGSKDEAGTPDRQFNGKIDEIKLWNRSLTADEVYQEYISNLNKYNRTQWYLSINQSRNSTHGLSLETYIYQTFARDQSNNINSTELRSITIEQGPTINLDMVYPSSSI
ncbi:MAG: LamG domain-containing protein, partial [Nanoarchaeota archaeon]